MAFEKDYRSHFVAPYTDAAEKISTETLQQPIVSPTVKTWVTIIAYITVLIERLIKLTVKLGVVYVGVHFIHKFW